MNRMDNMTSREADKAMLIGLLVIMGLFTGGIAWAIIAGVIATSAIIGFALGALSVLLFAAIPVTHKLIK